MKQLFIAWVKFQRRSESMQPYFGYETEFISFAFKNRLLRPLEYIFKTCKTLILFLSQRPQVIWVQLPPTPILHLAHLYKLLCYHQVTIIADCHNATFRPPWKLSPGLITLLNRCNLVLVHNNWIKDQAIKIGVKYEHLYILEDAVAIVSHEISPTQNVFTKPWILTPCSFNRDEPIDKILAAARLVPEITFVLTGNANRAQGIHDLIQKPPNVHLAGFLPKAEFDSLLCTTDAVLGLTTLEGIQLSVANEAVGAGKPMVISNTNLLKTLFYQGAVYVDAIDPKSIAQGCQEALSRKDELTKEVIKLKELREKRWLTQASQLDKMLTTSIIEG